MGGWVGGWWCDVTGRSSDGVSVGAGEVGGALVDVLVVADLALQLHHLPLQLLVHAVDGVCSKQANKERTS